MIEKCAGSGENAYNELDSESLGHLLGGPHAVTCPDCDCPVMVDGWGIMAHHA